MYVIEAQSGVNMFRNCTIGSGATEEEAWLDALGPKPWSDYTKKLKKKYTCRKLEEGEEPVGEHED
jgi:hypothetical protein